MRRAAVSLICCTVVGALAEGLAPGGATQMPRGLKQTTRSEIARRASRTRPNRAYISPGLPPPTTANQQQFVMQYTGTGQSAIDGTYAWSDPQISSGNLIQFGGTLAEAGLYYLDANSHLARSDGLYLYASDATGTAGPGYFVALAPASSIGPAAGNQWYFLKCSISVTSVLTCVLENPNTQENTLAACEGSYSALALTLPPPQGPGGGCYIITMEVYPALP